MEKFKRKDLIKSTRQKSIRKQKAQGPRKSDLVFIQNENDQTQGSTTAITANLSVYKSPERHERSNDFIIPEL